MKRNQWIRIAMIVCGVILAGAVIAAVTGIFGGIGTYANADKYTAGNTEITAEIRNIDVNWTSGKVHIAYHAGNTVTISETANKDLADDQELRWWQDGDTLRIQYAKSGFRLNWNLEKELTLTLPEGIVLENAEINLTSGSVDIPEMTAENLKVEVTSGDVDVTAEAKKAEFSATSGKLGVKMTGKTEKLAVGATSGKINVEAEKADAVEISSTSGYITVSLHEFSSLDVFCTSGGVTALLPAEPGFTADVSQTSGKFTSGLPMTGEGNRHVCGDGSAQVKISCTSGDVEINPVK